jgi:hypothetical protein
LNITLTFNIEQLNVILRALDQMPHAQVRQVIDLIVTEANAQQQAAQRAQMEADAKAAEQAKAEVE